MKTVTPIKDKAKIKIMLNSVKGRPRDFLLIFMGIHVGLRISDLLTLKVDDVLNREAIRLKEKKTGKNKAVWMHRNVKKEVYRLIKKMNLDKSDYLFKSQKGDNSPIDRTQAYRIIKTAASAAGLENIGTHSLRKTFGYHFYNDTKDIAMLQKLFNHSSLGVTRDYLGIEEDEQRDSMENFSIFPSGYES